MKRLLFITSLVWASATFAQVRVIDQSDTSIHVVMNYFGADHWVFYPLTSAVYVPPCVYRIVPPDSTNIDLDGAFNYDAFNQYQLVEQYGKMGVVNKGDTILIPLIYDSLIRITNSVPKVFIAKLGDQYGLLSDKNEVVIPFEYDRIHLLSNGHYEGIMNSSLLVEKAGKKGLMRVDGSVELSCTYDFIDVDCDQRDCPKNGVQYYVGKEGKYGYINRDESVAIGFDYDGLDAKGFSGLIKAENDGMFGLMDTLGHFIVPQIYEQLYDEFHWRFTNLTAFKQNGKWGLMHGDYDAMKVVLKNEFDTVMTVSGFDNHFIIINQGKWGLADTIGRVVVAPQFQEITAMEDGTFAYKLSDKWGFMNAKGLIHCSPRYDEIYENNKNWCLVRKGDGYGFCKTSGQQIAAPVYDIPIWDDYTHWEEIIYKGTIGLSKTNDAGECKLGVIDSTGRVLLPFEYDCFDELVYNFGQTLIATKNDKAVLIDGKGQVVDLGDYDAIDRRRYDEENYFFPTKGSKVGLVSPNGKVLAKTLYDKIEFLSVSREGMEDSDLYFLVEKSGKLGVLDSNGRTLLLPNYEELAMRDNVHLELIFDGWVKLYNLKTKNFEAFSTKDMNHFNGQIGVFRGAGGKSFFIDSLGYLIDHVAYDCISLAGKNAEYFEIKKAGLVGITDPTGKIIIEPKFSKIKFWDGTFGAGKMGGQYCFFDTMGDTIVGYRYEKVKGVYEDFVCVKIKGKFGVVNKKGETLVAPIYNQKLDLASLSPFGLLAASFDYKIGVLNSDFEIVLECKYTHVDFVKVHDKVYIITSLFGSYLLFDGKGEMVSSDNFSKWEQSSSGELFLFRDAKKFLLNEAGEVQEVN